MRSLQQKLLLYIIVIGVVPMLFFGVYYCDFLQKDAFNRLENESKTTLEQFDNKLVVKINRIQNVADVLFNDAEFCRILTEKGNTEKNRAATQAKLDDIYSRFQRGERELAALLLFPLNGGVYVSGDAAFGTDPQSLIMQYDNSGMTTGVLSWMGLKNKLRIYENEVVLAGTMLRDETYLKDEKFLGNIYLIFNNTLFGNDSKKTSGQPLAEQASPVSEPEAEDESISVYDENLNLLYTQGSKLLGNAFLSDSEKTFREIEGDSASFATEIDGEKYMVISYSSPLNGWKFVRSFPYERYFAESRYIMYVVIICFVLMFALWYVVNRFVVKRMTLPVSELLAAMKQVEKKNFDVELTVRPRSDFGTISNGFNSMVAQIKVLFERVLAAEKQKREQDILMLRYQMNPHFLYNTIGAIRVTAIMNKQEKIAKMLLILSRFLRNAILTANESLDVRSEVSNIHDYVSLYQLRYCDQLQFTIDVEEPCYDYRIPSMLCQPIIENALVHGLSDKFCSGEMAEIQVHIKAEGDDLLISVRDNGRGISAHQLPHLFAEEEKSNTTDRLHIGLKNIQKRIQLIFGADYGLTVTSGEGVYTNVTIRLPKKTEESI